MLRYGRQRHQHHRQRGLSPQPDHRLRRLEPNDLGYTDVLYTMMGDLLGEYDPSGGFKEYIYVDSKTAANAVDDTAVVRQ